MISNEDKLVRLLGLRVLHGIVFNNIIDEQKLFKVLHSPKQTPHYFLISNLHFVQKATLCRHVQNDDGRLVVVLAKKHI